MSGKRFGFLSKPQNFWDNCFLAGSYVLAGWSLIMWYSLNWERLPDWLPLPGLPVMDILGCFGSILFCITGLPALIGFIVGLIGNSLLLINRVLSWHISKALKLGFGLAVLGLTILPWQFKDSIEAWALNQAIARYDVAIDAIEAYRTDHGYYPADLNALVPDYLPEVPGKYMKFGEELTYEPNSSAWYDHAPFTFELYGHYAGIHGQTLKYCPVEIKPLEIKSCYEGSRKIKPERINSRWVWNYSSAL